MVVALLLSSLLAQSPDVGLTLSVAVRVPKERQSALLDQVARELSGAGLSLKRLDTICAGDEACLSGVARNQKLPVLVAAALSAAGRETLIDLEALTGDDPRPFTHVTLTIGKQLDENVKTALRLFAADVKQRLAPPQVVKPPDAPLKTEVVPPPKEPPPPLAEPLPPEPAKSRVGPLALGIGAVAAGAVSAGFGLAGNGSIQESQRNVDGVSPYTRQQANDLRQQGNTQLSVALGTGIAAGALAAAALVWLVAD
jgi:hypothetical protein